VYHAIIGIEMNVSESAALTILKEGLLSLGLIPQDERMRSFATYLSELKKWSKAYNLTGIRNDRDIVMKHFLDSLLYLRPVPQGIVRIADIGSGAGFPGIPIKIVRPEIRMYLIEPSGKKAAFLRHIARQLQMDNIEIIEKGVETITIPKDIGSPVDIALTRALFDIREFIQRAAHIVRSDGIFILSKGPKVMEELKKAGDIECTLLKIPLPQADIMRYIVVVHARNMGSG
jgi:16S rRNA (guanine527-N7)-methyltransferase